MEYMAETVHLEEQSERPAASGHLRAWLLDLVLAVGVSMFIIFFLYQPVRVEGTSMLPALEDQDRLLINKLAFRVGIIHRDDVVVFRYPRDHTKSYIKRVIGMPGDHIRIDHGQLNVNGKVVAEPYVPARFADEYTEPELIVPQEEYFVMGDHRSISSDSRDFGPVPPRSDLRQSGLCLLARGTGRRRSLARQHVGRPVHRIESQNEVTLCRKYVTGYWVYWSHLHSWQRCPGRTRR